MIKGTIKNRRLEVEPNDLLKMVQTQGIEATKEALKALSVEWHGRELFFRQRADLPEYHANDSVYRDLGFRTHGHGHLNGFAYPVPFISYRGLFK